MHIKLNYKQTKTLTHYIIFQKCSVLDNEQKIAKFKEKKTKKLQLTYTYSMEIYKISKSFLQKESSFKLTMKCNAFKCQKKSIKSTYIRITYTFVGLIES